MKLIILARDVVITHNPALPVESAEAWVPVPGSLEAVARLTNAGYHLVAITRPGPMISIETLNRIHERMHRLAVEAGGLIEAIFFNAGDEQADDIGVCFNLMLEEIRWRLRTSLQGVPVVGVAGSDFQAAQRSGAIPVLVRLDAGEVIPAETTVLADPALVFDDLPAVADFILAQPDSVRQ
jgi:D-glycero-D-manno-heptose 1,7-bisphosphate phosphatase